jgi:polysaccharide export outer membrane protein
LRLQNLLYLLVTAGLLASCATYRQSILFETSPNEIHEQAVAAESNYRIQTNDLLLLDVYTNQGETIVDPNRESFKEGAATIANSPGLQYLVDINGMVRLPLIGRVKVEGLTLQEAEEVLAQAYEKYYEDAYVVLQFTNKRVVVLGAPGGRVIPLTHENMKLTEVLALAEGITPDARANNIRVIRGDQIFVADLSTFKGYQKGNMVMKPGDVVYVEPVRRPFIEALRDYSPVISIVTSLATLIFIISQINR